MGETLAVAMVLAVCALLLVGYPVAFTLAGVSLGFSARCRREFSASRPMTCCWRSLFLFSWA
jgi:TRAP-type mannitol/chloroaromatic compound transport system permease large subunit